VFALYPSTNQPRASSASCSVGKRRT